MKEKLLNFIENILLKIYFWLRSKHPGLDDDDKVDRIMAQFYF